MGQYPLVSVIIPVYGVEKYIGKCLETLINQTYSNLEILVINDGTKDKSAKIAKSYAAKDKRIKVFDFENGGVSLARNRGIDLSNGEYISFIDGDDWVAPTMYMDLVGIMLKDNPDMIKFSVDEVDVENNKINKIHFEEKKLIKDELINKYFDGVLYIMPCNGFYKRTLAVQVRYPEGLTYEDNYTAGMYLALSNKVMIIPQVYYFYRVNLSGASKSVSKKPLDKCLVVKMLIDDLNKKGVNVKKFLWKFSIEVYHFIRGINSLYRVCAVQRTMYDYVMSNLDLRRKVVLRYLIYKNNIKIK